MLRTRKEDRKKQTTILSLKLLVSQVGKGRFHKIDTFFTLGEESRA